MVKHARRNYPVSHGPVDKNPGVQPQRRLSDLVALAQS